ncbi:hypothetical protein [Heyndrickxia shackletonii]|nr:hypothetical protein [Heyndrickxia shackletonii]
MSAKTFGGQTFRYFRKTLVLAAFADTESVICRKLCKATSENR